METCGQCGAPIKLYTLTGEWSGFPPGTQIWVRVKGGGFGGRAVCDYVSDETEMPPTGWLSEQLHTPLAFFVPLEEIIAGLQEIELDLR